jgi:hypothetical protein
MPLRSEQREPLPMTDPLPIMDLPRHSHTRWNLGQEQSTVPVASSSIRSLSEHAKHQAVLEGSNLEQSYCEVCINLNLLLGVWSSPRLIHKESRYLTTAQQGCTGRANIVQFLLDPYSHVSRWAPRRGGKEVSSLLFTFLRAFHRRTLSVIDFLWLTKRNPVYTWTCPRH